jgi:hypothetical protein
VTPNEKNERDGHEQGSRLQHHAHVERSAARAPSDFGLSRPLSHCYLTGHLMGGNWEGGMFVWKLSL